MFERFTAAARAVVSVAYTEADALSDDSVGTSHVLLGLLSTDSGAGYQILHDAGLEADRVRDVIRRRATRHGSLTDEDAESLRTIGIDLPVVLERLEESFGPDSLPMKPPRRGRLRFSRTAKKTLQLALREAIWLKAGAIGSEHILLALLRCNDSDINAILAELGAKPDDLRKATLRTIGHAA